MKYKVKFIENIEGRDSITHGGVSFPIGEAVTIDSEKVEMSPWFEGNSSFTIEDIADETTEDKPVDDDATEDRSDSGANEGAGEDDQVNAVKVKPTRSRKAVRK